MSNTTHVASAEGAPSGSGAKRVASSETLFHRAGHEIRNQLSVILLQLGKIADPAARQIEADVQAASETVNRISMLLRVLDEPAVRLGDVELAGIAADVARDAGVRGPDRPHPIEIVDQGNSGAMAGSW